MKLTVATVCFNSEKTISRCIESVLNIQSNDFEYLIIDGKSNDHTVEIAESYKGTFAKRNIIYKIVSEEDTGIYNAMNKAAFLASGDWIIYLNSDDFFYKQDGIQQFLSNSYDDFEVVYGDVMVLKNGEMYLQKPRELDRLKSGSEMPFCHQSTFTKINVLRQYTFDESYRIIADIDSFLRMYEDGLHFSYIPICISVFSNDGISQTNRIASIIEGKKLLKSHRCYSIGKMVELNLRILWYGMKKIL